MDRADGSVSAIGWLTVRDPEVAWDEFLQDHAAVVLQVVHVMERDEDDRSDCFVYVCEQLRRHRMRRLRSFDPSGSAAFRTWLRVVVRNLCLDWRRSRFGRPRPFRVIARMSILDREVFHCLYVRRLGLAEARHVVAGTLPGVTETDVEESCERISRILTPRQRWLLLAANPKIRSLTDSGEGDDRRPLEDRIGDSAPDPESRAVSHEEGESVRRAMATLSSADRLLLRLRFEQDLGLERIARLTGLSGDVQAHRRIQKALERLRRQLAIPETGP